MGAVIFLLALSCARQKPPEALPQAKVTIRSKIIAVEVADTEQARKQGLSGRESLKREEGMLFVFDKPGKPGFWMKGMKFPLDIIWIVDKRVSEITPNVAVEQGLELPITYYPKESVDYVLEVNAGFADGNGIRIGESVEVSVPSR